MALSFIFQLSVIIEGLHSVEGSHQFPSFVAPDWRRPFCRRVYPTRNWWVMIRTSLITMRKISFYTMLILLRSNPVFAARYKNVELILTNVVLSSVLLLDEIRSTRRECDSIRFQCQTYCLWDTKYWLCGSVARATSIFYGAFMDNHLIDYAFIVPKENGCNLWLFIERIITASFRSSLSVSRLPLFVRFVELRPD